jgi:MFS family permease
MKSHQIILWSYALSMLSDGILIPIYAFFVQKVGGGILETAGAISAFSIVAGITTILITQKSWNAQHKLRFLWVGWLIWLLGVISYLFIYNVETLFVAAILTGLGNALANPALDAEFSEATSGDSFAGWGSFEGINSIVSGVAALMGGVVVIRFGFDTLIYCMIVTAAASFGVLVYYVHQRMHTALH